MDDQSAESRILGDDEATGRRSALRVLGLSSLGALAGPRLIGAGEAKKQTRDARQKDRRRAQAEKKKKGGKVGPTGPAGPSGPPGLSGSVSAYIEANETVPDSGWRDLQTVGPRVTATVPASGRVLVILSALVIHGQAAQSAMAFEITGGSGDISPDSGLGASLVTRDVFMSQSVSTTVPVSGLSAGQHVFTAKYRKYIGASNTVTYSKRFLTVIPLP
ncbi:MAG: hypothetical protein M3Z20_14495 [Chloroflexota bacterium]|nr:hypothetical protein [Chloroflexota bacterium]